MNRVDELMLVESKAMIDISEEEDEDRRCVIN
jgi:hypothetical protein